MTKASFAVIILLLLKNRINFIFAGVAQSVVQLIRNQQVVCSSHITSSTQKALQSLEIKARRAFSFARNLSCDIRQKSRKIGTVGIALISFEVSRTDEFRFSLLQFYHSGNKMSIGIFQIFQKNFENFSFAKNKPRRIISAVRFFMMFYKSFTAFFSHSTSVWV